jgi:hypothetical protein
MATRARIRPAGGREQYTHGNLQFLSDGVEVTLDPKTAGDRHADGSPFAVAASANGLPQPVALSKPIVVGQTTWDELMSLNGQGRILMEPVGDDAGAGVGDDAGAGAGADSAAQSELFLLRDENEKLKKDHASLREERDQLATALAEAELAAAAAGGGAKTSRKKE